jgi:hypothetical protein
MKPGRNLHVGSNARLTHSLDTPSKDQTSTLWRPAASQLTGQAGKTHTKHTPCVAALNKICVAAPAGTSRGRPLTLCTLVWAWLLLLLRARAGRLAAPHKQAAVAARRERQQTRQRQAGRSARATAAAAASAVQHQATAPRACCYGCSDTRAGRAAATPRLLLLALQAAYASHFWAQISARSTTRCE